MHRENPISFAVPISFTAAPQLASNLLLSANTVEFVTRSSWLSQIDPAGSRSKKVMDHCNGKSVNYLAKCYRHKSSGADGSFLRTRSVHAISMLERAALKRGE